MRFVFVLLLLGAFQSATAHDEYVCTSKCVKPSEVAAGAANDEYVCTSTCVRAAEVAATAEIAEAAVRTEVTEPAEQESSDKNEFSGGALRLGAFFIDNLETQLYFGPKDIPLRGAIDIRKDLGAKDSLTAFRADFMYRFSKRHALTLGYYELDLNGTVRLGRTIELGETEFDIGIDVRSEYEEKITKLAYNYIFHDEGPVTIAITPGIHFSEARFSIKALGLLGGVLPALEISENKSIAAPLPMIGGRLVYRLSPKWRLIGASDLFFLDRGSQEGQLTDTHLLVEYQANDKFFVGGGLNRFALDLQIVDDDIVWDWSSICTGAHLYVGYSF
jgi:hypothetical protein